jgi:hypothetical protein
VPGPAQPQPREQQAPSEMVQPRGPGVEL